MPNREPFLTIIVFMSLAVLVGGAIKENKIPEYSGPTDLDRWANAIWVAEGGRDAVVPYGIFYEGCDWDHVDYCRKICKNTVYNTLVKYREDRCRPGESDLDCLARRYAPIGADNDPNNLNVNWKKNVSYYLEKGGIKDGK